MKSLPSVHIHSATSNTQTHTFVVNPTHTCTLTNTHTLNPPPVMQPHQLLSTSCSDIYPLITRTLSPHLQHGVIFTLFSSVCVHACARLCTCASACVCVTQRVRQLRTMCSSSAPSNLLWIYLSFQQYQRG